MIEPEITTERIGVVVRRLTLGEMATTAEIAAWCGVSRQAAWEMLTKLSRVNPITIIDGKWCDEVVWSRQTRLDGYMLESEYGDETTQRN